MKNWMSICIVLAIAIAAIINGIVYRELIFSTIGTLTERRVLDWISALSGWAAAFAALVTVRVMRSQQRLDHHPNIVLANRVLAMAKNYHDEAAKRLDFVSRMREHDRNQEGTLGLDELSYWGNRIDDLLFDRFDQTIGSNNVTDRIGAQNMIGNLTREIQRHGRVPHIVMDVGLFGCLARYFAACVESCENYKSRWERPNWLFG